MKNLIALVIILFLSLNTFPQNIKVLKPSIGKKISYTKKEQQEWLRAIDLLDKVNDGKIDYESLPDQDKLLIGKIESGEGPITIWGDNWYAGGGPYKILSSSNLGTARNVSYKPENIQDFNLLTAWGEGKSDYGIGEYIEFYFKPFSPRVDKIIIYDGYFKNQNLWKSNSRVKQFKLYINNIPYAILDLADTNAAQSYSIEPIQSTTKDVDLVLKFEILDIYKGSKYSDVLISEINFDGLDVFCLAGETQIQLAKFKTKNIEDLNEGDVILTYDLTKQKLKEVIINKIETVRHKGLVKYHFESGKVISSTQDHPFMLKEKGWSSLLPNKSTLYKGIENIMKIEIGDKFIKIDPNGVITVDKLINIEYLENEQQTYTISKLSSGENIIGNGFIVGIEELKYKK